MMKKRYRKRSELLWRLKTDFAKKDIELKDTAVKTMRSYSIAHVPSDHADNPLPLMAIEKTDNSNPRVDILSPT